MLTAHALTYLALPGVFQGFRGWAIEQAGEADLMSIEMWLAQMKPGTLEGVARTLSATFIFDALGDQS